MIKMHNPDLIKNCDMYEDIYNKGMLMGYGNYRDIITSGDYGIPKSKERYKWLQKICATKGINI